MFHRNHIEAFQNAKAKGAKDIEAYMYMYSAEEDFFKNKDFRNYFY